MYLYFSNTGKERSLEAPMSYTEFKLMTNVKCKSSFKVHLDFYVLTFFSTFFKNSSALFFFRNMYKIVKVV